MQITRQQMLNGAARYLRAEAIPHVPDKTMKVILESIAVMAEVAPQMVDNVLATPWVSAILKEENGLYDLDVAEAILTKATEAHGGLELTIPAIPLISRQEKTMTFSANDIRVIKRYMEG